MTPTRSLRSLVPLADLVFAGTLALVAVATLGASFARAADRVPITTASEEARKLYLEGRDLNDGLKFTDAHDRFLKAIALDPSFASAYLLAAQTSTTGNEFFEQLQRAVDLAPKVSEAERMTILGFDAGTKGKPEAQKTAYSDLAKLYPDDERVLNLLGNYYFGTQEYDLAIEQYNRVSAINPRYAPPYNQLGYAYRAKKDFPKAEQAFRKYIELVPDDPNPYDSYAEFLMKTGRFDESITTYRKALAVDKSFVPSYIGISNNYMFMGKGEDARKTCDELAGQSRNVGEKRQAYFWKAVSFLHENRPADAIQVVHKMYAMSEKDNDRSTMAGDHVMMGNILLESAGKPDEALAEYRKGLETTDSADVPAELKEASRRAFVYQQARVALAKNDLVAAQAKTEEYRKAVDQHRIPGEVRQAHEMAARVALAMKNHDAALKELGEASDLDPRVLYLMALAYEGKGDTKNAALRSEQAAHFNALNINYAYMRKPAMEMLEKYEGAR